MNDRKVGIKEQGPLGKKSPHKEDAANLTDMNGQEERKIRPGCGAKC